MTTNNTLQQPLSEAQVRFIDELMLDNNAAAAAQRAGFSPRKAKAMLDNPAVAEEIARRKAVAAAAKADAKVDAKPDDIRALIREADEALNVAQRSGSAQGMTSAITLKAKLLGLLDGDQSSAKAMEQEINYDPKVVARAVIAFLMEACGSKDLKITVGANDADDVLRSKLEAQEAKQTLADELAIAPEPPAPAPTKLPQAPMLGEREVLDGGQWIEYAQISGGPNPVRKWACFAPDGTLHGYRRSLDEARMFASSLRDSDDPARLQ